MECKSNTSNADDVLIIGARQANIENNMTQPSDAINNALEQFWEVQDGSNGSTEQEKLL